MILDADLAQLYGVTTKRLNEQVRRNQERFPGDFMFQLTAKESAALRSQIATASPQAVDPHDGASNRSQIATGSQKHRDPRLAPTPLPNMVRSWLRMF
ncbi:MAG: ORF6N domain-containing protein [Candidatus Acidiferrum sp.]